MQVRPASLEESRRLGRKVYAAHIDRREEPQNAIRLLLRLSNSFLKRCAVQDLHICRSSAILFLQRLLLPPDALLHARIITGGRWLWLRRTRFRGHGDSQREREESPARKGRRSDGQGCRRTGSDRDHQKPEAEHVGGAGCVLRQTLHNFSPASECFCAGRE